MARYIPLLRPASYTTLPRGLAWDYVETPPYITQRPDLPRSKHPHGMIETDRDLTADERMYFDLAPAIEEPRAPYPFCRSPVKCAGKGYCPNDPACND